MSVAFTKEESAETASETLLPDRPISPHANLVTQEGMTALELQLVSAQRAYEAAARVEDVNERRRQAAIPLRDIRYFAERVRTAQVIPAPASADKVAFGVSPVARSVLGKTVGDVVAAGRDELEIVAIS